MGSELTGKLPMVAILRGLEPEHAAEVGAALVEAGFEIIEVPLNSPNPFHSIASLAKSCGGKALIGAGTVLTPDQVDQVADAGGRLVVSPNCDPAVIARTGARGLVSLPGVLTPTEMFAAIKAGAHGLKIFPAELVAPSFVKAVRAVLPPACPVFIVGGIHAGNMADYLAAGATGFGLGGSLFKPGKPVEAIAKAASALISAYWSAVKRR